MKIWSYKYNAFIKYVKNMWLILREQLIIVKDEAGSHILKYFWYMFRLINQYIESLVSQTPSPFLKKKKKKKQQQQITRPSCNQPSCVFQQTGNRVKTKTFRAIYHLWCSSEDYCSCLNSAEIWFDVMKRDERNECCHLFWFPVGAVERPTA